MTHIGLDLGTQRDFPAAVERGVEAGYLQACRRYGWIVAVTIVLSVGAAAFVTARQTPIYEASAMMVLAPSTLVQSNAELMRGLETLERRTILATLARIPGAVDTRLAVAEQLGPQAEDVREYRISGSVLPNTHILRVDATGPDAVRAAEIANAAATVTRVEARSIYRIFSMRDLAQAVPRRTPVFPDPARNYLVAGVLGLLIGLLTVFSVDWLLRRRGTLAAQ